MERLRAPGATLRLGIMTLGSAIAAAGFGLEVWWLTIPGCIMVGWSIQPDADRYYLEGFTDGFGAGTDLMAESAGDGGGVGGRREGDRADDAGRADDAPRTRQWAAVAATPIPRDERVDVGGAGARPPRPATDERGEVIPVQGPRPVVLPDLPEAVARGTRSLDLEPKGRAAAGGSDGAGVGPHRDGT
jgi:hypothetical protein